MKKVVELDVWSRSCGKLGLLLRTRRKEEEGRDEKLGEGRNVGEKKNGGGTSLIFKTFSERGRKSSSAEV